jgi:hypothetical protein
MMNEGRPEQKVIPFLEGLGERIKGHSDFL